ncbi:MAG: anti-phage-associated DUF3780 domain-containing protein [Spirochaetales bacterium]
MNNLPQFEDFGAPTRVGSHIFLVDIPISRSEPVLILENYGFLGGERGIPEKETRVSLNRSHWYGISEIARQDFNDRLKGKKMTTSRWTTGLNKLDKLLGKELCVLAWAAEQSSLEQLPIVCHRWVSLRPEERWWLFRMTVAEAGLAQDLDRGWRKALHFALSDGKIDERRIKRPRPDDDDEDLSLFGGSVQEVHQ